MSHMTCTATPTASAFRRSAMSLAVCSGLLLMLSQPVLAQEAEQKTPAAPADKPAPAATDLDTITVTGSRIRRAGFDTLEPATVLSREYIEQRGLTNVADALNEMPGFGAGVTPEAGQSSFGVGVNFVNRFGLGSNRTLTVVNGRRFVSSNAPTIFGPASPGVQVDLNVIPTQLIERVENLTIGGAPTYGSDAIAGTVNIILRKDYEGMAFGTSYGLTDRGDNQRYNFSGLMGQNFDRGNITFSVSYDKVEGVLQKDRGFYADGYFNTTNPSAALMASLFPGRTPGNDGRYNPNIPFNTGSADGIPNAVLIRNRRIYTTPAGGLIYPVAGPFMPGTGNLILRGYGPNNTPMAFDSNGNLVAYNPGIPFTATDASGGDGLDLVKQGQITSNLERKSISTMAHWDLTDNVTLFFEGMFYSARSRELTDQSMYNSPLFSGLSAPIRFPANHAMLTPQAQATLAQYGQTSFMLSRASRDIIENNASASTELRRGVLGLEGNFELGSRTFYWEATANYGRSDNRFFANMLNQQRFVNALHVVRNGQGQVVCSPTPVAGLVIPGGLAPVADPACVPLDMFGAGRPSEAARAYVTDVAQSRALIQQTVYNVNVSSTLLDLWSGPLLYNVGYERRKEQGNFIPDEVLVKGLGRSAPVTPTRGEYTTNEWFGEMLIPLVNPDTDIPLLKKLDVTGKYRQVDNTINGKFDTYTYGLQWKPFEELELRGNKTRSLRAPGLTELYTPTATSFSFVNDPCDNRFISGGTKPSVRARNCAAFLNYYGTTPGNFVSNAVGATVQGTTSGNRTLANEESDAYTYGFTWSPSFAPGLKIAADYSNIKINNVIANLTATNDIPQGCFDNDDFNTADIPNANKYCSMLIRNSSGQITSFRSGFVNGEYLKLEAYEAKVEYSFDTDRLGFFHFGLMGYFPRVLVGSNNGVTADESVGEIGTPKQSYQLNAAWRGNRLGLTTSVNYTGSSQFDVTNLPETRDILKVDAYWLVNAGASYQLTERTMLRLAVTNLFDKDPPFPFVASGVGTYDLLGRRYTLSFAWNY